MVGLLSDVGEPAQSAMVADLLLEHKRAPVYVYMQMNTSLAVFLRNVHGANEQMFGCILALNAAMVVLFQFPITRR